MPSDRQQQIAAQKRGEFRNRQRRNQIIGQLNQLHQEGFTTDQIRAAGPNAWRTLRQQGPAAAPSQPTGQQAWYAPSYQPAWQLPASVTPTPEPQSTQAYRPPSIQQPAVTQQSPHPPDWDTRAFWMAPNMPLTERIPKFLYWMGRWGRRPLQLPFGYEDDQGNFVPYETFLGL